MNILEIGEEIGKEIGRDAKLVELICRKLQKGKSAQQIAEELEENESIIEEICNAAGLVADYDPETVYEAWKRQ